MGWFTRLVTQLGRQIAAPSPLKPGGNRPRNAARGLTQRLSRGRGNGTGRPPRPRTLTGPARSTTTPRRGATPPRPDGHWSGVAYHGTPSRPNAKAIFQNGFLVGNGNASGDGVYFATDPAIAKSYAGSQGVILKCELRGRCCQWSDGLQAQYAQWCGKNGVRQDNSARTAFLIQRGYDLLRTGSVVVVLSPQMANPSAWQMKDRRIRVLGAYDAATNQRVRV